MAEGQDTPTPVPGGDQPPAPDAADLEGHFRESIPAALVELGNAWRDPDAWTGMTRVGGVDLPRQVAGLVALDELVVHGWDLARATGQGYDVPASAVDGALGFVALPLARLLGLTGRDPQWCA